MPEAEQGDPLLTDVGIGEEVSFTYEIFLPELEVDRLFFTDQLPSTFNFGRAEVVEVGSNLMLQEVMQSPNGGLVDLGGTSVIIESNRLVTIDFGAVTNILMDDDVDNDERIVIRVTGSVGADPANVAGMQLTKDAQIELFLNPDETEAAFELADQRTLDIVEPELNIDNSPVVATTGAITTGGAPGDSSVRVDIGVLDIGQSATITFDATLADTALFNSAQTNTATLVYDSHPDANAAGEWMYGPETDDATVSTPSPTITKTVDASSVNETAGSSLVVGEVVTFRTTIDMPEGSSPMTLIDSLPASGALSYRDARIVSQTSNVSFSAAPTVATAGTVTTVDFNTVTVAGATPTVGGQIVVEVDALFEDVAAVINGAAFTNSADLNFNDGLAEAEATVAIVEPALTVAKSAPASAILGAPLDYSLTVNHTGASTAAAFDLVVADPLSDPNLILDTGSVSATVAGVALDPSAITITAAGGQQGFAVSVDALLLGQTLAISYQAQLAADAPPSTTFVNTAVLAFDSVGVADQVPGAPGRSGAATASASTVSAAPAIEEPIDRPAVPVADEDVPVADEETLLAAIVARAAADDPTPPPVALAERAPIPTRPPLAITGTTVTSTLGFGSLLAAVGFSCLGFARRRRTTPEGS